MRLFNRRDNEIHLGSHDTTNCVSANQTLAERAVAERVMRWYGTKATPVFGAPTRCPDCGNYGMVDRIDEGRGVAHNSCMSCKASWSLSRRALEQRPVRTTLEPLGGGILVQSLRRELAAAS